MNKTTGIKIKKKEKNGKIIFKIKGQLSADTIADFEKSVDELSDVKEGIIIDLAGVNYVSRSGLRLLLRLSKIAHAFRKECAVINVQDSVRETFDATGFTEILNVNYLG